VLQLLVAMGYGGSLADASHVGRTGDGGIDGIIREDHLGLDNIYVQAKRWDRTVPIQEVRAFSGSLDDRRARKGVLITTSQFPRDAERYASSIEKRIVLIDGQRLAQLMVDHGVGVTVVQTYTVKRLDTGHFDSEGGLIAGPE
jgi:restriction system protein